MNKEDKKILMRALDVLMTVVGNKDKVHVVTTVNKFGTDVKYVNREERLEDAIEYVISLIEGNIDLDFKDENDETNVLIKQFLEFRKQFTKKQWQEINQQIDVRLNKKAAELQLDDEDIRVIEYNYKKQNSTH